jgi:hypothetical protein
MYKLFPQPSFSDDIIDIQVEAGVHSVRYRESSHSESYYRLIRINNKSAMSGCAELQFSNKKNTYEIKPASETLVWVNYEFESDRLSFGKVGFSSSNQEIGSLNINLSDHKISYTFEFRIDCYIGEMQSEII